MSVKPDSEVRGLSWIALLFLFGHFKNLLLQIFLFIMTVCTSMCVWGNQKTTCWSLILSFYHVGPTDWTQVISLDDKQFYPLHSTDSTILLFFCKVARKLQSRVTLTSGYLSEGILKGLTTYIVLKECLSADLNLWFQIHDKVSIYLPLCSHAHPPSTENTRTTVPDFLWGSFP